MTPWVRGGPSGPCEAPALTSLRSRCRASPAHAVSMVTWTRRTEQRAVGRGLLGETVNFFHPWLGSSLLPF